MSPKSLITIVYMSTFRVFTCVFMLAAISILHGGEVLPSRTDLEDSFKRQGRLLLDPDYKPPADLAARGVAFSLKTLANHALYLRHKKTNDYLFISSNGTVQTTLPGRYQQLKEEGEVLITNEQCALFIDEQPVPFLFHDWRLFWVATEAVRPNITIRKYPTRQAADDFMREDLIKDSEWQVASGQWGLQKRGGGLVKSDQEMSNYNVQRAVNPFAVRGEGDGVLTYGAADWPHSLAEACFYFGIPNVGPVVERDTVPTQTDMMIARGDIGGYQVAFGWSGQNSCYVIQEREGKGAWKTIWKHQGSRPALTNWVRMGLAVKAGCVLEARLDGKIIKTMPAGKRIRGPFHLVSGKEAMEVDDVRATSLPLPETKGSPVFVQSRQFAGKTKKGQSDPEQYLQWSRSTDTFIEDVRDKDKEWQWCSIINRMPLMGDFTYESVPYHKDAKDLPPGIYEFRVLKRDPEHPFDLSKLKPVWRHEFLRDEDGWRSSEIDGMKGDNPRFTLRFRRRASEQNRICVEVDGKFRPISEPITGAVHISISRLTPINRAGQYPHPQHHALFSPNLVNEFFEHAPVQWSWIDGAFRMASRWACQDQWNFMACGAVGVPMMVSKRRFGGAQEHAYFMTIRPVQPWDAGDKTFTFDVATDRAAGWPIFKTHHGWYNRHDLNFSFCTNGKDPLSGYAVIYGGKDNQETQLLRKGKVVARSTMHLFPTDENHGVVHWRWWKFSVRKAGKKIKVMLNDEELFDYTDEDPIEGGHTALWSIRNGFVVTRIISTGETVSDVPDVLYVDKDVDSAWTPLLRDAVTLAKGSGKHTTTVASNVGAGFMAVRWRPEQPVNLRTTPILTLPVRAGDGAQVNIHLRIGEHSYLIPVNAPLKGMKSLLTSEYEKGEQFQRRTISSWAVRNRHALKGVEWKNDVLTINLLKAVQALEDDANADLALHDITIGNASNADYLLVGGKANQAGARFHVGTPRLEQATSK